MWNVRGRDDQNEEQLLLHCMEFCRNEVLTAVLMKIQDSWDVMFYQLANNY